MRRVVDYRARNCLTISNKDPLPIISKLLDKTRGGIWFTRLDLKNGFYLIGVAVGHEWKTGFRTKKGLFPYIGMQFALTNAPATCQKMLDTIFKDEEGSVWYIDDTLIYGGQTEAEHQAYVETILPQSVNHGLAVNLTKSEFHVHETIFLVHIVNDSQVQMDPAKLETMSK